jgi:Endoplasmic reticulum vesicle transporter/Endoplasmic Reticulum-Golgi Intermediate Compartment (ERGIC)
MINLDISLHRFPCSLVSLDIQDIMGSHTVNVHGTLTKNKLSKDGKIIGQEVYKKAKIDPSHHEEELEDNHGNDEEMPDLELVKKEIDNEEGCQVFGHFFVNKVPGNFHLSGHAYGRIIQTIASMGLFKFDVTHTVNHLSFGDEKEIKNIQKVFNEGVLSPLDKVTKRETARKVYEYYVKVNFLQQNKKKLKGGSDYIY